MDFMISTASCSGIAVRRWEGMRSGTLRGTLAAAGAAGPFNLDFYRHQVTIQAPAAGDPLTPRMKPAGSDRAASGRV